MTAVLMPSVHSYFAIYTLEGARLPSSRRTRGLNWDLHATATDRSMAISHARMLALQPGVSEVQVKQVTEDLKSGQVHVRDITRCTRGARARIMRRMAMGAGILACAVVYVLFFQ